MSAAIAVSNEIRQTSTPGVPLIHYWEVIWNRMHQAGWRMGHTTWTDLDTGGVRHLVCAERNGVELRRSAPTMTLAVQAISRAAEAA